MTRDRLVSVRGGLLAVVAAALVVGLVLTLTSGNGHRQRRPAGSCNNIDHDLICGPGPQPANARHRDTFGQPGAGAGRPEPRPRPAPRPVPTGGREGPTAGDQRRLAETARSYSPGDLGSDVRRGSAGHPLLPAVAQRPGILAASPRSPVPAAGRPGVGRRTRSCFCRVLDPHLVQSAGSPIVSSSQWEADAKAGVRQTVSDLLVQPDPGWQQLVASGWQPTDARMDILDVAGLLTVTSGSHNRDRAFHAVVVGRQRSLASRLRHDLHRRMAGDGVSCLSLDPAKTVTCLAGTVSKAAAADVFGSIAHDFATAADSTINWLWAQMSDATAIRLGGTAFNQLLAVAGLVAIVIAVGIFAIQMAISAVRRDPSGIGRAAGGLVVMGLGGGAAIAVTELLLQAVDAISAGVLQVTTGDSMQQMGNSILAAGSISGCHVEPGRSDPDLAVGSGRGGHGVAGPDRAEAAGDRGGRPQPVRVRGQSRRLLPIVGAPMGRTDRRFGVLEADPDFRLRDRALRPPQRCRQSPARGGTQEITQTVSGVLILGVGRFRPVGGHQNGPLRRRPPGGDAHDGRARDGRRQARSSRWPAPSVPR